MKKMLLMTILMSFVGSACANTEVSDAQLLGHLKNIRSQLISIIDENRSSRFSEFSQEEMARYNFFATLISEFYNKAKTLQRIVTDEIVRPEFDVVCDNISLSFYQIQNKFDNLPTYQRMNTLVSVEGDLQAQDPVEISEDTKQELFELFVPIFEKTYQEYSLQFSQKDTFGEKMAEETIRNIFKEILDIYLWHPEMLMDNWPMIDLLNAKIAELEVQV